jgi:very-short-patch-repair endonuclease
MSSIQEHSGKIFNNKVIVPDTNDSFRVFGTYEEPLFVAKDISAIMGYKDTKKAIKSLTSSNDKKKYVNIYSDGEMHPNTILITRKGVETLLSHTRLIIPGRLLTMLKESFGVCVDRRARFYTKEEEIFTCFEKHLKDVYSVDIIRQLKVGNYYVDACIHEYKELLECDENGHSGYDLENDKIRTDFIKTQYPDYTIIRFNPDTSMFNAFDLLTKILKSRK